MSDIVLSSGVRANLLQLQQTANLITSDPEQAGDGQARQFRAR